MKALNLLRYTPTPKAKLIAKVVKSTASNAENNFQMDGQSGVVKIYADEARGLR